MNQSSNSAESQEGKQDAPDPRLEDRFFDFFKHMSTLISAVLVATSGLSQWVEVTWDINYFLFIILPLGIGLLLALIGLGVCLYDFAAIEVKPMRIMVSIILLMLAWVAAITG